MLTTLLIVGCTNAQEETTSSTSEVTSQVSTKVTRVGKADFQKLMENSEAQLIDVRSPREVSQGKIGDAQMINFFDADFKQQINALDKTKPVLIYCASGNRSGKAVNMMKGMGFSEIHELAGGYGAWLR